MIVCYDKLNVFSSYDDIVVPDLWHIIFNNGDQLLYHMIRKRFCDMMHWNWVLEVAN